MDKVYIAVSSGGSYEDAWECNCIASLDKQKIVDYVDGQNARIARLKDFQGKLMAFSFEYDQKNPFNQLEQESQIPVPKWPAGIDQRLITSEMRAERDSIRAFNAEVISRNHQRVIEYNNARNDASIAYLESIGFDFADLGPEADSGFPHITSKFYRATDIVYRVEEVDLL